MVRHFLTLEEYNQEEIWQILRQAQKLKKEHKKGKKHYWLEGKTLAMIFEKPSTRTRISFEVAMIHLGGNAITLAPTEIGLGTREAIADIARTINGYCDAVMIRTFEHEVIEQYAKYSKIPVINGLTNLYHPCQALADGLTILEVAKTFENIKVAYFGDGYNVANSLMVLADRLKFNLIICTPKGYEPDPEILGATGKNVTKTNNIDKAIENADIIYTDVWASMGLEEEKAKRLKKFAAYQVNKELVKKAKKGVKIMHCLPAKRGEEITNDVIDSRGSIVFQQAENRLHVQKALLIELLS